MLVIVLAAIDAFGWGGLIFVGLLFGIPYSRYFLRAKAIPKWPTATATVAQASEVQGTPLGYGVVPNLLHHCSVIYEYEVNEVMYRGSFALMAGDEQDASTIAQQLMHTKIPIRYNPTRLSDSLPTEKEVLGRKVILQQSWLNPKVW